MDQAPIVVRVAIEKIAPDRAIQNSKPSRRESVNPELCNLFDFVNTFATPGSHIYNLNIIV
jgi:hypothetical protein